MRSGDTVRSGTGTNLFVLIRSQIDNHQIVPATDRPSGRLDDRDFGDTDFGHRQHRLGGQAKKGLWGQAKWDKMLALKFKRNMGCPRSVFRFRLRKTVVHLGPFSLPSATSVAELVKSFGFRRANGTWPVPVPFSPFGFWWQAKCDETRQFVPVPNLSPICPICFFRLPRTRETGTNRGPVQRPEKNPYNVLNVLIVGVLCLDRSED
jgi:hypothetical protein